MPHTWSDWTNQTLTNLKLSDTWQNIQIDLIISLMEII